MGDIPVIAVYTQALMMDEATRQWVPMSSGYTQLAIYNNPTTKSYRLIGLNMNENTYGINSNITPDATQYAKATETFHQLLDGTRAYGFNFYTVDDANNFNNAFQTVLADLSRPVFSLPPPGPPSIPMQQEAIPQQQYPTTSRQQPAAQKPQQQQQYQAPATSNSPPAPPAPPAAPEPPMAPASSAATGNSGGNDMASALAGAPKQDEPSSVASMLASRPGSSASLNTAMGSTGNFMSEMQAKLNRRKDVAPPGPPVSSLQASTQEPQYSTIRKAAPPPPPPSSSHETEPSSFPPKPSVQNLSRSNSFQKQQTEIPNQETPKSSPLKTIVVSQQDDDWDDGNSQKTAIETDSIFNRFKKESVDVAAKPPVTTGPGRLMPKLGSHVDSQSAVSGPNSNLPRNMKSAAPPPPPTTSSLSSSAPKDDWEDDQNIKPAPSTTPAFVSKSAANIPRAAKGSAPPPPPVASSLARDDWDDEAANRSAPSILPASASKSSTNIPRSAKAAPPPAPAGDDWDDDESSKQKPWGGSLRLKKGPPIHPPLSQLTDESQSNSNFSPSALRSSKTLPPSQPDIKQEEAPSTPNINRSLRNLSLKSTEEDKKIGQTNMESVHRGSFVKLDTAKDEPMVNIKPSIASNVRGSLANLSFTKGSIQNLPQVDSNLSTDLSNLKKELLADLKVELNEIKQEIIDTFRGEIAKLATALMGDDK